jgi:YXWGXW repeat-containing protein
MFTKKVVVSALIAAGTVATLAVPLPSSAQAVQAEIYVLQPPPPPRVEVVPAPRSGYVWVPGHYQYRTDNYVWAEGSWEPARPGYVFRAPAWVEREGRWVYQPPRWDRDGDGVPNRRDNFPNNPNYR